MANYRPRNHKHRGGDLLCIGGELKIKDSGRLIVEPGAEIEGLGVSADVDERLDRLSEEMVKSINGVKPDSNGNVSVTGDGTMIDATLSVAGAAADAKAVGDTITKKLNWPVTKSGSVVKVNVAKGLPLKIVSEVVVAQSGEGIPSIDNVRPFIPRTSVMVNVSNNAETQTYSAQLGENVYLGTYDFASGLLTVTGTSIKFKPVQRDEYGDKGFARYQMWHGAAPAPRDGEAFQLCTFAPHRFANHTNTEHFWVYNDTFLFETDRWSTLAEAQEWCAANDARFVYTLATPYTVQLNPHSIVSLDGENVVFSDGGDVTVTGVGDTSLIDQTPAQKYGISMMRYIHMPRVIFHGDTTQMTKENEVVLEFEYRGAENYANAGSDSDDVRENGAVHKGWAKVKWQGSSSLTYVKKNYTIKLYADADCIIKMPITLREKWGAQYKYCLKANFIDPSMLRNNVAAKIWATCFEGRNTDSESFKRMSNLPNRGAIDGYPAFVFINDEYRGMYTMNIPKDEWMFGMKDGEGRNVVLCAEKYCDSTNFSAPALIDGSDWSYEVSPADKSWVLESFNRISTAVAMPATNEQEADSKRAALEACVDVWSVIDYDIFIHRVGAMDNMKKNLLCVLYDNIWCVSAYDLDTSWLNSWTGTVYSPASYPDITSNALCTAVKTLWPDRYTARKNWLTQPGRALSKDRMANAVVNFMIDVPQEAYVAESEVWPEMCGANTNAISQILSVIMLRD